jgi:hypothetical protein
MKDEASRRPLRNPMTILEQRFRGSGGNIMILMLFSKLISAEPTMLTPCNFSPRPQKGREPTFASLQTNGQKRANGCLSGVRSAYAKPLLLRLAPLLLLAYCTFHVTGGRSGIVFYKKNKSSRTVILTTLNS